MERPTFGTRARQRIWREFRSAIRARIPPFVIGVIGIAMGYMYSWLYLHKQIKETAGIALMSGVGANIIWFLCVLIYNTVHVPWLLDAESASLLNEQETRTQVAEMGLVALHATRKNHDLFGHLMQQGVGFSCQIATCRTDADFASWDRHSNDWTKSVQQAMRDMGFPTDAVEFARSAEYAEPVKGEINTPNKQEQRVRVLEKRQESLADFVRRRLS